MDDEFGDKILWNKRVMKSEVIKIESSFIKVSSPLFYCRNYDKKGLDWDAQMKFFEFQKTLQIFKFH